MNKVTTINLNGRAYQVEEKGYAELHEYLERATVALSDNPDKVEILNDLEQAIADKCQRFLGDAKDVITEIEVTTVLDEVGPVENENNEAKETTATADYKSRRLYAVPGGSIIAGVCNGLAAYLGVEPTLVRIAFVVLTFATGGFWILVYLGLAIFLPYAKTEQQLAEAYGRPITAHEIIERAKGHATNPATLSNLSRGILQVWRILARLVTIAVGIGLALTTGAWIMALGAIGLGHAHLQGNLTYLNGGRQWLFVTALYLMVALPLVLLARIFNRIASDKSQTRRSTIGESSVAVFWGVAVVTAISFTAIYASDAKAYVHGHQGYIDIGNNHICIDAPVCHPNRFVPMLPTPPPYVYRQ